MTVLVTGGAGYIGGHMVLALLDAGESVVVLDNLSTGFAWAVPPAARLVVGDIGDAALVDAAHRGAWRRRHRAFRRQDRRAGIGRRSARLLPQQHGQGAQPHRMRGAQAASSISSSPRLPRSMANPPPIPSFETAPLAPINRLTARSKLMVEWMLQDAAAAHRPALRRAALFQRRRRRSAGADRPVHAGRDASHQGRGASSARPARRLDVFGTDYPTPDGTCIRDYIHVSDLVDAHLAGAAPICAPAARPSRSIAAMATAASVLEVVDVVKQRVGRRFRGAIKRPARRRSGRARCRRRAHQAELGWAPKHDNLSEIVRQALDWERRLHNRKG